MEYLYKVDKNDEVVGKVERREAHDKLIRHRTSVIFLMDKNNRIFLTKRSPEKQTFGGYYDNSYSFHVKYGESYEEATKREGREELGIENNIELLGKFFHIDPPSNHVVAVYKMEYTGENLDIDFDEMETGQFLSLEEVRRLIQEKDVTPLLKDRFEILQENLGCI